MSTETGPSVRRVCVRCGRMGVQQYISARQDGTPAVTGEAWVCANERACLRRAAVRGVVGGEEEFRIVIDVAEDDYWDWQEIIVGQEWTDVKEAEAYRAEMDLSRYPEGTSTYIEHRVIPQWRRL